MLRTHCRKNCFRHQERRGEVDLDRFAPLLRAEIGKPSRQRKRGVVYENVDPSKTFERTLRNVIRNAFRGDIARHCEGALADLLRQRLSALTIANIHCDRCTALVQTRCGSPSKATPCAGDDGNSIRKVTVFHQENSLFRNKQPELWRRRRRWLDGRRRNATLPGKMLLQRV